MKGGCCRGMRPCFRSCRLSNTARSDNRARMRKLEGTLFLASSWSSWVFEAGWWRRDLLDANRRSRACCGTSHNRKRNIMQYVEALKPADLGMAFEESGLRCNSSSALSDSHVPEGCPGPRTLLNEQLSPKTVWCNQLSSWITQLKTSRGAQ